MSVPDMTAGSWTFMVVSWALLVAITLYCFSVMLRRGKKT